LALFELKELVATTVQQSVEISTAQYKSNYDVLTMLWLNNDFMLWTI